MNSEIMDEKLKREYDELVKSDAILPIKVSNFYMKKVKEEVQKIGRGGPLYRSVLPIEDRITIKTSIETRDYVEEEKHMPIEGVDYIIRKYEDRLIFIVTDVCFAHCQYCFRTYNLSKFQQNDLKKTIYEKVCTLKKYLRENPKIEEVILSGGDPLSIDYANLSYVLKELRDWNIRIHTRAIVYHPYVFNNKIVSLLKEYNVRLVFHINHPYEICKTVESKIIELNNSGIRLYAQFPLLRGINDNSIVLKRLLIKMDELHIRPLSIFIPDPISYSATFRVGFKRIIQIIDEINWHSPSWINSTRFVMDTTIGKVRRENIINWNENCIVFSRDNKEVKYYDLDDNIDIPSKIDKLLWKEYGNK
jgi:lysine 2,3-aminomutase